MSVVTLHEGDNRITLRRLIDQGVRVHSVVTDPPYGLTSVTKRFGKEGAAPAKFGSDGAFSRASAGFMGKAWDGTGIERDPEFWRLVYDILLPGGFVFAFSGSRTGHWQACAMELAGFIMHPMHGWLFGSGMPKAHNPCPQIDRMMGAECDRITTGETVWRLRPGADQNKDGTWEKLEDREYEVGRYVPTSPEAQKWDGWRYGTQTQKPALEPIYLGQKPYSEKTGAANLLKHGVGALNIDGCRIDSGGTHGSANSAGAGAGRETANHTGSAFGKGLGGVVAPPHPLGRWPANVLHDSSDAVVALFPDSAGQLARSSSSSSSLRAGQNAYGTMLRGAPGTEMEPRNDSGSAARFFNSFPLTEDDFDWAVAAGLIDPTPETDVAIYQSKAGKADRAGSKHPTVKPIALMQHLVRHITPPGGVVLDPFAGSGTTAEAARREGFDCILMEAEPEYATFLRQRFNMRANFTADMLDDLVFNPPVKPQFQLADLLS